MYVREVVLAEMARFRYQMKTWSPYNGVHKSLNTDPPITITKQSRGGWQLAWGEYVAHERNYRDALEHVENAISMGDRHSAPISLISKTRVAEAHDPYPTRQGSSAAAYQQFILDVMHWKQRKYGDPKWDGRVGEDLSKSGIKVAQQMAQQNIVQVTLTEGYEMGRGRSYQTVREYVLRFTIVPGPNFPSASV